MHSLEVMTTNDVEMMSYFQDVEFVGNMVEHIRL